MIESCFLPLERKKTRFYHSIRLKLSSILPYVSINVYFYKKENRPDRQGGCRNSYRALFACMNPDVAKEEIFGPVLAAIPYETVDEVIERANRSEYGLAAGVWTENLKNAHYIADRLQAGTVWVPAHKGMFRRLRFSHPPDVLFQYTRGRVRAALC